MYGYTNKPIVLTKRGMFYTNNKSIVMVEKWTFFIKSDIVLEHVVQISNRKGRKMNIFLYKPIVLTKKGYVLYK